MPTLPINVYQSRARLFRLDPQVGFTIARNIKESKRNETEVPRGHLARQKWILRPMAGFTLSYSEFRDRIIKPTFSLTYQIRWPLKAEDYYAKSPDGDNNDVYVGQSRLPRQYWKSKLEFDIGTIVTPFIAYESGRLPPNYKLISGQFKLGFSLKFVRKPVDGVSKVDVSFEKRQAVVSFDDAKASVQKLTQATENAGYPSTAKR